MCQFMFVFFYLLSFNSLIFIVIRFVQYGVVIELLPLNFSHMLCQGSQEKKKKKKTENWDDLITPRKAVAACQDKNINDEQPEREREKWMSCKIHCLS